MVAPHVLTDGLPAGQLPVADEARVRVVGGHVRRERRAAERDAADGADHWTEAAVQRRSRRRPARPPAPACRHTGRGASDVATE